VRKRSREPTWPGRWPRTTQSWPVSYMPGSLCFETPTLVARGKTIPSTGVARRILAKAVVRRRQGVSGELRILLGGFSESKEVQLRIDLNRLQAVIIPSRVDASSRANDRDPAI